jgi:hypothetical protein
VQKCFYVVQIFFLEINEKFLKNLTIAGKIRKNLAIARFLFGAVDGT